MLLTLFCVADGFGESWLKTNPEMSLNPSPLEGVMGGR